MPSICVIGAGVSGLTTAVQLMQSKHQVSIIAEAADEATTSSAAAAFWYPFWTGDEPDHSWYRPSLAWQSFVDLDSLANNPESGVTRTTLNEYFDAEMELAEVNAVVGSMWWKAMPRTAFKAIPENQLRGFSIGNTRFDLRSGINFQTLVVNMSCYMPFLTKLFLRLGGEIAKRSVKAQDLEALCKHFDYVVNCAGLGARTLANDNLEPREGLVIHLAPVKKVQSITLLHTGPVFAEQPIYIVPRGGEKPDIVIGGSITKREGVPSHIPWSELAKQSWSIRNSVDLIYDACRAVEPAIADAAKLSISIGYRPLRMSGDQQQPVRIEPEFSNHLVGRLLHNYGHAGGGITLSWGCAKEMDRWISWFENGQSSDPLLFQTAPPS